MIWNDDPRGSYLLLDAVQRLDYYFIAGTNLDEIISGFRSLTGKAALLPKWAYGYLQSREVYHTQQELMDTVGEKFRWTASFKIGLPGGMALGEKKFWTRSGILISEWL